jgi:hypothetical protein
MITQQSKYLDPRWQKLRLKIFERDDFHCLICGDGESQLHAHHTFYYEKEDEVEIWDYPESSLMTVCEHCHKNEHEMLFPARNAATSALSSYGLGSIARLKSFADAFEYPGTQKIFDQFESDTFCFAIEILLRSRLYHLNPKAKELELSKADRFATDEMWVYFKNCLQKSYDTKGAK